MKQKLFIVALIMSALSLNGLAQEKIEEKTTTDKREQRARVVTPERIETGRSLGYAIASYSDGRFVEENRVSLNLSKRFQGETITSDAEFDVPKDVKGISLNLSGSCKKGEIEITISLPNGDTYKSQKITSAADVRWSAVIPFKEEDGKKYVGTWKLKVKTNNTEGDYNLNISSR